MDIDIHTLYNDKREVTLNVYDHDPNTAAIVIDDLVEKTVLLAHITKAGAETLVNALTEHFDLTPKAPQPAVRPIVFAGPFEVFDNLGDAKDRMLELLGDGITSTVVNATVEGEFNSVTGLKTLIDFRYAEPGDLS